MGGDGTVLVKDIHVFLFFIGNKGFIDLAVGVGDGFEVKLQMLGQEEIEGITFIGSVIVAFFGEMGVLDIFFGIEETVDITDIGVFYFGSVFGPVLAIADHEHGAGRGERGNFDIIGFVVIAFVYGHTAFANATAEEMGGNLNAGHGNRNAVIHRSEQEGLGAAAGSAGNRDAFGIDIFESQQKIDGPNTVPELQLEYFITVMLPAEFFGHLAVADHIIGKDDCAHTSQRGTAGLHFGAIAAVIIRFGPMAVGAEDRGTGVRLVWLGVGAIEAAGDEQAGGGFERGVFDGSNHCKGVFCG